MTLADSLARLADRAAADPVDDGGVAPPAFDLARLVRVLGHERRLAESVVARLHLVRLAVEPGSPIDLDVVDAGLSEAIDQLRQTDLLRAVLMAGEPAGGGLGGAAPDPGIAIVARAPTATALRLVAGDLAASVQAARAAIGAAVEALDGAIGPGTPSSRRRSALRHLVTHAVPAALAEGF